MTKPRKEPVSRPHHLCHIDWFITLRVCVPHLVTVASRHVEHRPRFISYDRNALIVDPNIIIAIVSINTKYIFSYHFIFYTQKCSNKNEYNILYPSETTQLLCHLSFFILLGKICIKVQRFGMIQVSSLYRQIHRFLANDQLKI